MKTLAERLKYAMEVLPPKKIKGVDLARAVGVKPPSVSDWLSGKSKTMEGENLLKASKFLNVNANWLASGTGSPADKKINNFQEDFSDILYRDLGLYKIPILEPNQAGSLQKNFCENIVLYNHTYTDYKCIMPDGIFSIIIQDESMEPDLRKGDMVIIDTSLSPSPGNFVIGKVDENEVIIRKYRETSINEFNKRIFQFIPLNKDYPTLSSISHEIKIIGVIVRQIRNFKQ